MVVSLTLNHRRKPTVGRADPPVVPVTDEISPNKNSQLIRGQAFRIVAVIEKLAFHSGPHAFTSSIIVAPATITVHALYNAIFRKRLTVGFTGILSSSVGVHNGTSQIRMRQIGIIQCMLTQSFVFMAMNIILWFLLTSDGWLRKKRLLPREIHFPLSDAGFLCPDL